MTLHISNLSKRYGNNWVLRDVSFSVGEGEVLAILGASGSGRSTLARVLAGVEKPSPEDREFGIDRKSVLLVSDENARTGWWPFGKRQEKPPVRDRVLRALDEARDVVVFEDVLAGVDGETRADLAVRIRDAAAKKHLSVIYLTANFQTAALAADRVAVLADSYIQQTGTPAEIYESPVTAAVARLSGRCNIISARRLTSTKLEIPEFQTIAGDHRLFAERADIAKLGAINRNVSLAIRPENISMSFGASFPEDNLMKAVVTGSRFLGPMTIVELNANGLDLEVAVIRLVGLEVGQECVVALPPDRVKILKDRA
jgi:iron(III) transport system ATP-binding protein